jgi:hypothetical protein
VTTAGLAARCLAELGPVGGAIEIEGTGRVARALARSVETAGPPRAAVCVFVGDAASIDERRERLRRLGERLPAGAPLLAVDHNQPRAWWRRCIGHAVLAARGFAPSRGRRSVALDIHDVGFRVERLRLVAGERIQLVVASATATTT